MIQMVLVSSAYVYSFSNSLAWKNNGIKIVQWLKGILPCGFNFTIIFYSLRFLFICAFDVKSLLFSIISYCCRLVLFSGSFLPLFVLRRTSCALWPLWWKRRNTRSSLLILLIAISFMISLRRFHWRNKSCYN